LEASEDERKEVGMHYLSLENALRKSEEKYRSLVEDTHVGIVTIDPQGRFTFVNKALCEMLGYSEKEMLGKSFADLLYPEDATMILPLFQESLTSPRRSLHLECRVIHNRGHIVYIEASARILKCKDEVVGFNSVITDVTDRKRAEAALRDSEDKFRSLYLTMREGVCLQDIIYDESGKAVDFRITDINPSYESIMGLTREEVVGSKASELRETGEPPNLDIYARVAASGESTSLEFYWPPMKKHFSISAFSPGKGRVATVFADISERKRFEAQLLTYQKELRSLAWQLSLAEERERRRIAMEVHDRIGQTLVVCRMKLGELVESAPSILFAERLDEIHTLIKQLVNETRSLAFDLSSPLLYEVSFEAAVEQFAEQMQVQHSVPISFEDDEQPKPLDNDVRVLLFQAVRELLMNIAKHAHAHHARICLKKYGGYLRIIVADDGVGFSTSKISSDKGRTKGFGLFSVRERLHYMGGHMRIKSKPGCGTRITLEVPLKRNMT
jgi:PAS domain S-box-containing protein